MNLEAIVRSISALADGIASVAPDVGILSLVVIGLALVVWLTPSTTKGR